MTTRKWGSEFQVNTQATSVQWQPAITSLSDGGFMVAWTDQNPAIDEIRMQRFDAQGNPVASEFLPFDDQNSLSGSNSDLVQLADGTIWFVSDRAGGSATTDGQVVTLEGANVRDQLLLAATASDAAVVSLGSNGAAVVGVAFNDIFMNYYDSIGSFVSAISVNTNDFGTLAGIQESPEVAANAAGNRIAVTWIDAAGNEIHARVFDNLGTQIAAEFKVNIPSTSPQQPAIVWISNDRFVVTWTEFSAAPVADTSLASIQYAIYTENASLIGSQKLANTTTTNQQQFSDIVALKDGGFAIAWEDFSQIGGDSSGNAIRLQLFNALGEKRGDELLVNTTTSGNQYEISLATLSDGRIVVSWSYVSTGEIMSQIVDPRDGVVDGTSAADTLYGHDAVGDVITGFDGADSISGLAGDDTIFGGAGGDTLAGGRGDDAAYGGADIDTLNGNQGDDQLFGGKEADTLTGGKGDDEYNGGAGNDVIFEGDGADAINGGADIDKVDYFLAAAGLTTSLDGALTATGAAAGDTYISIEHLAGSNFADILRGNASANTIFGRNGDDRIIGAGGADTLLGNAGSDSFAYGNVSESAPSARDQITDFTVVAGNGTTFADRIDLSAIDAIAGGGNDAFAFIGSGPFTAAGQVRVTASGASDTLVEINTSGASGAEMAIILKGILPTAVFDEDFVL